jgi:site-specific DNA-methyltransferase (adenine-specific)
MRVFESGMGEVHCGDCADVVPQLRERGVRVDMIFVDPPFNLDKRYGPWVDDAKSEAAYRAWLFLRLQLCVSILADGGSIFVYNLPRWNVPTGAMLEECGLAFVNLIAVKETHGPPRKRGLYPSHYSLIQYAKGKPRVLHKLRVPIDTCRHCGKDVRDYGGHRSELKTGITLSDIWNDVPSVRHKKYKALGWSGPQLSTRLVRRCVLLATGPGDLVLDPMAGSGTTAAVCQDEGRRWIAIEAGDTQIIVDRVTASPVPGHPAREWVDGEEEDHA